MKKILFMVLTLTLAISLFGCKNTNQKIDTKLSNTEVTQLLSEIETNFDDKKGDGSLIKNNLELNASFNFDARVEHLGDIKIEAKSNCVFATDKFSASAKGMVTIGSEHKDNEIELNTYGEGINSLYFSLGLKSPILKTDVKFKLDPQKLIPSMPNNGPFFNVFKSLDFSKGLTIPSEGIKEVSKFVKKHSNCFTFTTNSSKTQFKIDFNKDNILEAFKDEILKGMTINDGSHLSIVIVKQDSKFYINNIDFNFVAEIKEDNTTGNTTAQLTLKPTNKKPTSLSQNNKKLYPAIDKLDTLSEKLAPFINIFS